MRYTNTNAEIISIHAPARGATAAMVDYALLNSISIHAPARGATVENYISYAPDYKR